MKNVPTNRLSQIDTSWTQLGLAHGDDDQNEETQQARQTLLHRYATPVYQYLLACVRDETVAEDLAQDFAIRFLRGRFENADEDRGRFRDFVKRSLSNLATDHFRRLKKERKDLRSIVPEEASASELNDRFQKIWRQEILNQVWQVLQTSDDPSDRVSFIVLQLKAENPESVAAELAPLAASSLEKTNVTEEWFRQNLHRARKKFGKLLRNEISQTLGQRFDEDVVDEELAELKLLQYCT